MSEFQYCYWLMGIFELGSPKTFSANQMYLIKEHLNLVRQKERKHTFCNWLEGFLDANGLEGLTTPKLNTIMSKLREEFIEVIDKSYPKELWNPLQAAHDGKPYVEKVQSKKKETSNIEALC